MLLLVITLFILAVAAFACIAWQFDQGARATERHTYLYSIDLSYTATIENVTMLLPVPELNGTPRLADILVNGEGYGVPAGWNLSLTEVNGTPVLSVRAARMVPEYHGYPIAIEPGQSPLPPTLVPGTEYSSETPVLIPVHLGVMLPVNRTIDTHDPLGHEPVFVPGGQFSRAVGPPQPYQGTCSSHAVPLFIQYTSDGAVEVSLHASVQGINSIWRGGWVYNSYQDTVTLEPGSATGWVTGEGTLCSEEGVYY